MDLIRYCWQTVLAMYVACATVQGFAQTKVHHTYPMPRPVKPVDPLTVSPGVEVPLNQDAYRFVSAVSKYTGTEEIFVYDIDGSHRRSRIGTLPAGTEIKMTAVTAVGKTIYYAIPWQNAGAAKVPKIAWISGYNIKAASFNPPVK